MYNRVARWTKLDESASSEEVRKDHMQRLRHPPKATIKPALRLILPYDGVIFMTPTDESRVHAQRNRTLPAYDHVLSGHLEVEPPSNSPRFRCHAIRIRFEAALKPDSATSIVPDEVLFEREVKIAEDDEEGILIDQLQRFDFSLIIPNTVPPRNWGEWGCIMTELYAVLEGVEIAPTSSSPPTSPSFSSSGSFFSLGKRRPKAREEVSPRGPREPQSPSGTRGPDAPWLAGRHEAIMPIRLIYNPDSAGGVNILKEEAKGNAPGLGEYQIRLYSDVWTIASLLSVNIALMDIPPATSIFYITVHLIQTSTVTTTKDSAPSERSYTQRFLLMDKGAPVERQHLHPDHSLPALWRGKGAHGHDEGAFIAELEGRVTEDDFVTRPSTLPSIKSPVRTSHSLQVAIFFSVWGENAHGRPLHIPGPGGLRLMKMTRAWAAAVLIVDEEIQDAPTDETKHVYKVCACHLSMEEVQARMREAIQQQERMEARDAQLLLQMKDLERG